MHTFKDEGDAAVDSAGSSPMSLPSPLSPDSALDPPTSASSTSSGRNRASGPLRSRSASRASNTPGGSETKEKRKRSRVTPEQLAHLERFFATDRSPTASRRREISEMLGMQERQTQIWFQNRRAKAKLVEGKKDHNEDGPPDFLSVGSGSSDAELFHLLHETEPIHIIPCTELSIGAWRRMASAVNKYDLVAYACESDKRLTWFIQSSGQGFKMEMPFSSIADANFVNTATPGVGQATFILSQPPIFYLETVSPGPVSDPTIYGGVIPIRTWKQCTDFTEGNQATKILRHSLTGAAIQLAHVLRTIAASTAGPSIPLYLPSYQAGLHDSSMDVSMGSDRGFRGEHSQPQHDLSGYSPQLRLSTRSSMHAEPNSGQSPPNTRSMLDRHRSPPPHANTSIYSNVSETGALHMLQYPLSTSPSPANDYQHLPISHRLSRRSFTSLSNAQPEVSPYVGGQPRSAALYPLGGSPDIDSLASQLQHVNGISLTSQHPPSAWESRRPSLPTTFPGSSSATMSYSPMGARHHRPQNYPES